MINDWIESLAHIITQNMWFAPFIALLAGLLTSLTPCSLSTIPLVLAYVAGNGEKDTKRSFKLSLTFSIGMAITFTILGTLASLLGRLMQGAGKWWYIVLGVLMVLMALQTWEIFNFIPSTYLTSKNEKRGYIGALLSGILGGIFSSPCSTPVLIVLLGIVARSGNVGWGIILLLLYSIGHSAIVLIAGTSYGFVKKITQNQKYGTFSNVLKYCMGGFILIIGLYMFWLGF